MKDKNYFHVKEATQMRRLTGTYERPKYFDMELFEVGSFRVTHFQAKPSGDTSRFITRLKIVFAKRRIIYEFPSLLNQGLFSSQVDVNQLCEALSSANQSNQVVCFAFLVPFDSVSSVSIDRSDKSLYLSVKQAPLVFSSSNGNASSQGSCHISFGMTSNLDPTCGQLKSCSLHRIKLKGNQAERFVNSLSYADMRLKRLIEANLRVNPDRSVYRTMLPDAEDV